VVKKTWFNIPIRDALMAGIIVLLISCSTCYVVYVSASNDLKKTVQNNLLNIAKSAEEFLDKDAHQKITKPEEYGTPEYEAVRAPFFKLLRANINIKFIYTVIKQDNKYYFILDSSIPKSGEIYNPSKVMTEYVEATDTLKQAINQQINTVEEEPYTDEYGTFLSGYTPFYNNNNGQFIGVVGVDISIKDFLESLARIKKSLFYGSLIATFASVLIGVAVWFMRMNSLNSERINNEQHDKIKKMELDTQALELLQKVESEKNRKTELNLIASEFEQTVLKVVELVVASSEKLRAEAERVASIAESANKNSSAVASDSVIAARSSEEVSLSINKLTSSISEISELTHKSNQVAQAAASNALQTKNSIETLSLKSVNIGKIVEVINNVARQINLLALNATIESARAGEAGKGFAIVAYEIKILAEKVNKSTSEISSQISSIQEATNESVDSVMNIILTINEVSSNTLIVANSVEEQSVVTDEIAKNTAMTANGARNISGNITQVEKGVNQVGQIADKVLDSAINLDEQSYLLKEQIDKFITKIRSL